MDDLARRRGERRLTVSDGQSTADFLSKAFDGKRVLVTGHTGFKGAWLCEWLLSLGADVTGLGLAPETDPNLFELLDLKERMDSHIGDIAAPEMARRVIETASPDFVFHMAAQSLVRRSYRDPLETVRTNVFGTACLLDAVRRAQSPCAVVNVTSDKCYENRETFWAYRETDPMGGADPYSASKGAAEIIAAAFDRSFYGEADGPALASARAGNVIGGGDWSEDRLIPDLVRAAVAGAPVDIRSPHAVRPWQHVLEPLNGYMRLGACLALAPGAVRGGWNFGPDGDEAMTVEAMVRLFDDAWRGAGASAGVEVRIDDGPKPHEAALLRLDIAKATNRLGWRPLLTTSQAVEWTAQWHARVADRPDLAGELCRTQIADVTARLNAQPFTAAVLAEAAK